MGGWMHSQHDEIGETECFPQGERREKRCDWFASSVAEESCQARQAHVGDGSPFWTSVVAGWIPLMPS